MAELQASYIQASSHPADTDRLVLEGLLNPHPALASGAGITPGAGYGVGSGATELQVTQNGTPNMSVNVAAGHVWIDGTEGANQGVYHCYNDATKNLAVAASDPTNPRKDLVVARVQDAAYSGGTNAWSLAVVTGTPAASPVEPAAPANAHVLAMINVAAGATSITNANITDRRRRAAALGGIVVCTSTTRPTSPTVGQTIYETDTNRVYIWNGSAWVEFGRTGAWSSYAPTHSGVTLGNGSQNAFFMRIGRLIAVRYRLTFGSTTAFTGNVAIGLPVAAPGSVGQVLAATLLDSGTRWFVAAGAVGAFSTSTAQINHTESGNAGIVNATNPFTWTTSDELIVTGIYEAAA